MYRIIGITLMLIAIALVAIPRFTDCESQGKTFELAGGGTVPMKCHWSGIAEIGVAVPMYIVGAIMTTSRSRKVLSILGILGILLGGLAIAFPTRLIGVCQDPTMVCSTVMKPALSLLGSGAVGLSGLGLGLSIKRPFAKSLNKASLFSIVALSKKIIVWRGV